MISGADDGAPVLFVHGIKGGRLRDPGGLRWLGPTQALGLDRRPLALPLSWSQGQDRDALLPDGPLQRVLWVSVYGRFLDRASRRHAHLVSFAYDWRRELPETAALLRAELAALADRHGRPARIVAHSMGGLLAWLVLREHPELACGLLVAGTPFGTGVAFAADVHLGAGTGLNRHILSPEAVNSWSSHPVFFPTFGDSGLRSGDRALEHDWYEPGSWEHHGLGVFAEGLVPDPAPWRAHLSQSLSRARATRALLEDPGALVGGQLPIAVLRSSTRPTPSTLLQGGAQAVRGWDMSSGQTVPGDGRVRVESTEPPGLPFEVFETEQSHEVLLDDPSAVEAALAWLVERA
jgi:pimeloyl-ACP methyl ester carboxylesterase